MDQVRFRTTGAVDWEAIFTNESDLALIVLLIGNDYPELKREDERRF
jgi:hypothetical protein